MKSANVTQIRRIGFIRINQLVRAHAFLDELKAAFAEWNAGEIYVCKKTGDFRYRFGDHSKAVTTWSAAARRVFSAPEAFAFAAMVLGGELPDQLTARPKLAAAQVGRANVIALAQQSAA